MSRPVLVRTSELLERVGGARVFWLAFVLITAVHAGSVQDPPYWDALMGAFAQGHWLATHSFSPLALLRDAGAFVDGGACVYPFSVYPWIAGALEALGLAPGSAFFLLHVVSFASAAALVAATFLLLRDVAGAPLAALGALALAVQPMFRALACQMNMDMPLAACTLLSILALVRARHGAATAWAALALAIKPTAVILVAANLAALALRLVRPAWFGSDGAGADRRNVRVALCVHAGLLALFVVEMALAAHFRKSVPGVSLFGGTSAFLLWRLWTLPEFGLGLAAALLALPWMLVRAARSNRLFVGTRARQAAAIDLALFVLAFTGFYCQYENVLPRYFLQAGAVVLALLVMSAIAAGLSRRWIGIALAALFAFGVVNADGRFYPTRTAGWKVGGEEHEMLSNDGWLLERSLEYRDDLALDREIASRLERRRDAVVVAGWPLLQALAIPQMGYVVAPPRLASAGTPIDYAPAAIAHFGALAPGTVKVRVISPNVYDDEHARILPRDEVLEVVTRGRLRAFLVRRIAVSRSDGR